MDDLRFLLLLIGLVVLGLIWLLHRPDGGARGPGASRREERRRAQTPARQRESAEARDGRIEPSLSGSEPEQATLPDLGEAAPDAPAPNGEPVRRRAAAGTVPPEAEWKDPEPPREARPGDQRERSAELAEDETGQPRKTVTPDADPPKIVTLYVRARGDRRLSGLSLLDAAIKAGLRFGEMKIFHRRHRGESRPVFSMANITRPGSFDPSGWNLFETPGVTLFMTLPGPVSALDAWDAMLATGQRLSELLDADLMDDSHCLLTRQRIAQIREEMREFDRRSGLGTTGD
jgi:cell division protein ZipA